MFSTVLSIILVNNIIYNIYCVIYVIYYVTNINLKKKCLTSRAPAPISESQGIAFI